MILGSGTAATLKRKLPPFSSKLPVSHSGQNK